MDENGEEESDEESSAITQAQSLPSDSSKHVCPICRLSFPSEILFASHSLTHVPPSDEFRQGSNVLCLRRVTAVSGLLRDYELRCEESIPDVAIWLRSQSSLLSECVTPLLRQFAVRSMFYVKVKFVRVNPENGALMDRMSCFIPSAHSSLIVDLNEWFESHTQSFLSTLNKFSNHDNASSWQYDGIDFVLFKFSLSLNYGGRGTFKLPTSLLNTKSVINVDCKSACFKYALLSILHYEDIKKDRQRVSKYRQYENELQFGDINPDEINISKDVPKIEKLNNLKINIHVWERGLKGCRYNKRNCLYPRTVNLLLVVNAEGERHYCGIASISRLYYHQKKNHCSQYMCGRCIRSFKTENDLVTHVSWCIKGKGQIEMMPKEKEYSFKSFGQELNPLRVVYADAECYIEPETQSHQPAAIACYEVWHPFLNKTSDVISWQGEQCIESFLNKLDRMVKEQFEEAQLTRNNMIINPDQQLAFDQCVKCPKCKKEFSKTNKKVRDHCHITGEYRGPLCHCCNSRLRLKRLNLPVIFHNLKNYDAHLIIKNGIGKMKDWHLSTIAQSREKFMSLTARIPVGLTKLNKTIYFTISFIDSYQFMNSSLASLALNLTSLTHVESLRKTYPNLCQNLFTQKGVFPYSYFDSLDRLKETSLPAIEDFANDLTGEECSEEDYQHAKEAWTQFNCRTFGDYMLSYLKLDVLLLADVFEAFRKMSMEQDGLEPTHFVSLPGLSFSSAFKMTGETIHLLQDPFLYNMFERGIRGGLTFVNVHRRKAETKRDDISGQLVKNIILYIDQNNLYGQALSKPLPHSNFKLLTKSEIDVQFPDQQSILNLKNDSDVGYVFEVDLDYPSEIHDLTANFPLAPESMEVTDEMLSDFMKEYYKNLQDQRHSSKKFKSCRKLLMSQYHKEHYVVHYVILKFYLQMGMRLKEIHHAIQFNQKSFLEPYIKFNSERRALATNSFEKDFYKYKNNSLFGKTMEDVRKRMNYKLSTNEDQITKLISSPLFLDRDIITEDIVGIKMMKPKVTLDKPIYIGQAVLDYSKLTMYELFYKTLPQCPLLKQIELLGGDTDSFFLNLTVDPSVTTNDILKELEEFVDFSNYPPNHPLYSTKNKARLGCFKDECAGEEVSEIILLKPKMYSIQIRDSSKEIKRAKGITKSCIKNIRHETYKSVYHSAKETYVNMTILKSSEHTVHTVTFRKRALSCFDDKRCWLSCNASLPHGHFHSPVPPPKRRRVMLPARGDVVDDNEETDV